MSQSTIAVKFEKTQEMNRELELSETFEVLGSDNSAAYRLIKDYDLNKDRIRELLEAEVITPGEANGLLKALKLTRNRCC